LELASPSFGRRAPYRNTLVQNDHAHPPRITYNSRREPLHSLVPTRSQLAILKLDLELLGKFDEIAVDTEAFPSPEEFGSWFGGCPGSQISAEQKHGSRSPKGCPESV